MWEVWEFTRVITPLSILSSLFKIASLVPGFFWYCGALDYYYFRTAFQVVSFAPNSKFK